MPPPFRPVASVDIAAACAALVLPRSFLPRLDQSRLDLQSLIDSLRGKHEKPFHTPNAGPRPPTPLQTIDPLAHVLPQPLARRYLSTRRDLHFLSMHLRGLHPPPFFQRAARPLRHQPKDLSPIPFQVTNVQHLGADAVQIDLEAPPGSLTTFLPGQFLTLTVEVDGATHRRAYSIWSTPEALPRVSIAVKRVPNGAVSGYLHDHIKPGDTLLARGPAGLFTVAPNPTSQRHLIAFAAGSGITPILSIVQSTLRNEPLSQIDLVYGNRHEHTILFRDLLDDLASIHGDRFRVHHVLSQPSESWQGTTGHVNDLSATALLEKPGLDASAEYLLCGPDPMMRTLRTWLDRHGIAASQIHQERFVSPRPDSHRPRPSSPQPATYRIHGKARDVLVPASKTVLQAGLDAGLAMGHSCAMGGCGACKVMLQKGSVHMDEPNALTARERDAGYVLACIAYPQEPIEVESP